MSNRQTASASHRYHSTHITVSTLFKTKLKTHLFCTHLCWSAGVSFCVYYSGGVCVCVCVWSLVCVVGVFLCTLMRYIGFMGVLFFLCLIWWFSMIVWTPSPYCFWVSYMHAFSIFAFAPVQHNWACFIWKSALKIHSLLLLLLFTCLTRTKGVSVSYSVHYTCANQRLAQSM